MDCRPLLALACCLVVPVLASAQSPYTGMQARQIKALSDQQIDDLRQGRGMGLALAAELNGYPGPAHLLELADAIGLDDAQRRTMQGLFDAMKAEAIALGERVIAQEAALDRLFAARQATAENVAIATAGVSDAQGKLRASHLRYHLLTIALLRPEQIEQYIGLRGYRDGPPSLHRPHQHR